MGLLHEDNCGDTYDSTAFAEAGWGGVAEIVAGRVEGGAIRMASSNPIAPSILPRSVALGTEFTRHFALMLDQGGASGGAIMRFREGSTVHIALQIDGSSHLQVTRGTTTICTGTAVLSAGVWYQVEIHVKVHDSTGEIDVKIDESADSTFSGDTRNGGTAGTIDGYDLVGYFGTQYRFDDIHDWSGEDNKGNTRVVGRLVDGDGFHGDWTPSSVGDHYLMVDDPSPDSDTTYVSSDTGGNRDSYTVAALGVDPAATVYAVIAKAIWRKIDIGTRVLALFTRVDSTDYDGSDTNPSFGYRPDGAAWEDNPDTVAAWTVAEVDAAEIGILDNTP